MGEMGVWVEKSNTWWSQEHMARGEVWGGGVRWGEVG